MKATPQYLEMYEAQGGVCPLCGDMMHPLLVDANRDHILPVSRGGKNQGNIRLVHEICNTIRSNRKTEMPQWAYRKERAKRINEPQRPSKKRKAQIKRMAPPPREIKVVRIVKPAPTMMPCTFSQNGFCRTQLDDGQCGIRLMSFAHKVCAKNRKRFVPGWATTEEDDHKSRIPDLHT